MTVPPPMAPGTDMLAVALGANLGDPAAMLVAVRPLLAELLTPLAVSSVVAPSSRLRWSPLFRTAPVGGPPDQPDYLNAVALLEGVRPDPDPLALLLELQELERRFGRERRERWGPRLLDLDLLWCGEHVCRQGELELPHPRLAERAFVLAPLAAIDPALVPPLPDQLPRCCGDRLADLLTAGGEPPPERLAPRPGWPE
ncbi:2-amino-4-hydroxy-6-hydroxymethyldihydropteridine diphosphokinase [Synechococcus sp. CBW1004]|uniref:2-amino-4-hydroxy-6- hydroxymethyldihydropteridine diphosphokinase n=1 Tax=Synechococcus sp. CBW1004 TaxID=1353136 RepID=UPI0018CFD6D1|nr:2-amino-4-hydroxy-6-hydroxymethyldihydropteridine diphosphokinase [Synechococcus sp. CBW1004]QPN62703.1 2-amino-4-hydroxy-6-hydroxymethyldihydropteridine diphosphokinase [Synechococcus sp. CBW1004]